MHPVKFAHCARAVAHKVGGLAALEAQTRVELQSIADEEVKNPRDLMFHQFMFEGVEFLVMGGDDSFMVDTCIYKEMLPLKEGPFIGKKVLIPLPESEDE